jgi:mRNA interferase MazF
MAYQRGDVLLMPFPHTDLSAKKTRPVVVVSGNDYHASRPDLLVAYITSQISFVGPLDYLLTDWAAAGLMKPSLVRPKLATLEPTLIVHRPGRLTATDLAEVDRRLALSLALSTIPNREFMILYNTLRQVWNQLFFPCVASGFLDRVDVPVAELLLRLEPLAQMAGWVGGMDALADWQRQRRGN